MLVAMTLVIMMMMMFANMFGTAVGTMRRQRSLANNDQKARAVTALLRSDLEAATYKSQLYSDSPGLVPLMYGDVVDPNQKGYFYICENDPRSETDDNIQFTIWTPDPMSGKAQPIGRPDGSGPNFDDLNQPDGDDGILGNGVTWSRAAEVCYFLRAGTLYRRVLLLRDPLPHEPKYPGQPTMNTRGEGADLSGTYGDRLMPIGYSPDADVVGPDGDFWNDFDSSVAWVWDEGLAVWRLHFNSIDSLDNNRGRENHPLGMPDNRFGSFPPNASPLNGQFLEFVDDPGPAPIRYIGRFTHQETSSPSFGVPGAGAGTDPLSYEQATGHTLTDGVVVEYFNGPRAGEDIVMTGVEAFNIEVLDEGWTVSDGTFGGGPDDRADGGFPKFVNLGMPTFPAGNGPDTNNEFGGDWSLGLVGNSQYPNHGPYAGCQFDTWHPNGSPNDTDPRPPYRPMFSMNTADQTVYALWESNLSRPAGYFAGEIVTLTPPASPASNSIAYRCIIGGTQGATDEDEPEWPKTPGVEFTDNEVLWRSFDDRIGLKMIRITIRYVDGQTGGLKQLTTYHSFVESR
jgi:hypothetical protein